MLEIHFKSGAEAYYTLVLYALCERLRLSK